jgi:EAL domain-containing protein (putative c-di-GMP-specific phosphodiesterase class I)
MNALSLAKFEVESDLRGALERDELVLIYRARVDVLTGLPAGAETLIRWQHPRRGLMPPAEFIPIAEYSGLIVPLTAWVVRAACRQLRQWQNAGLTVVPLSINHRAIASAVAGIGCETAWRALRCYRWGAATLALQRLRYAATVPSHELRT